jgi:hypothetical protein
MTSVEPVKSKILPIVVLGCVGTMISCPLFLIFYQRNAPPTDMNLINSLEKPDVK